MSVQKIIMTDNGTACTTRQLRPMLSPDQRDELARLATHLGISLQQAYVRLRSGAISLSGQ